MRDVHTFDARNRLVLIDVAQRVDEDGDTHLRVHAQQLEALATADSKPQMTEARTA